MNHDRQWYEDQIKECLSKSANMFSEEFGDRNKEFDNSNEYRYIWEVEGIEEFEDSINSNEPLFLDLPIKESFANVPFPLFEKWIYDRYKAKFQSCPFCNCKCNDLTFGFNCMYGALLSGKKWKATNHRDIRRGVKSENILEVIFYSEELNKFTDKGNYYSHTQSSKLRFIKEVF